MGNQPTFPVRQNRRNFWTNAVMQFFRVPWTCENSIFHLFHPLKSLGVITKCFPHDINTKYVGQPHIAPSPSQYSPVIQLQGCPVFSNVLGILHFLLVYSKSRCLLNRPGVAWAVLFFLIDLVIKLLVLFVIKNILWLISANWCFQKHVACELQF